MPVVRDAEAREQEPDRQRVRAGDREPEPRAPPDLRPRAQQHLEPLPRLLAAGEDDPVLALAGGRLVRHEHAVRDDLVLAGQPARLRRRARAPRRRSGSRCGRSGTPRSAFRTSSSRGRRTRGTSRRRAPRAMTSVAVQIAGVIGSCRWRTSKRSRSSVRWMRKYARGESTMFGSEPFAGTITERPTGMTFAGGSPWRPTRGWSARVNCPGGSLPMMRRTSWPSSSSAAACDSACSTTAPQNDHENGTTIPIFTGRRLTARRYAGERIGPRRRPPRDLHHGRRAAQRRLLHARPRAAPGQEDRQPGRSDRLPPLLRGRAGEPGQRHHVLRVPGRRARPGGCGHGAHGRVAPRLE